VVGIGLPLAAALRSAIDGLRAFPAHTGPGFGVPSTQDALWCWLRGEDRGELVHLGRQFEALLEDAFVVEDVVDAFKYGSGRDLTGYEDGTENPKGEAAVAAALATGGLQGSSFVAVQQWLHDLDAFEALSDKARDHVFGRRRSDNVELTDAPDSAHIKRTAQESFTPPAFVLRRSMPWADSDGEGLVFVAFGRTLDAFETLLAHMTGADDGVVDSLFSISRPITGASYWCPPVSGGHLDLSALGIKPTRRH